MTSYSASSVKKQGANAVITFELTEKETYIKMPQELVLSIPLADLAALAPAPAKAKPAEAPKPAAKVEEAKAPEAPKAAEPAKAAETKKEDKK